MGFHKSVFVNCPFDDEYLRLLRPLLFTIRFLGLQPRIALETLDSGTPRIDKITRMIAASRFAIHDLSRLQASRAGEYYRLNMPFELGLDVGCRLYGNRRHMTKRTLILEQEPYRYKAAVSDLAGSDIACHHGKPETLVAEVRNWLDGQTGLRAPGPAQIWAAFLTFTSENDRQLKRRGFSKNDIRNLPVDEFLRCVDEWCAQSPSAVAE